MTAVALIAVLALVTSIASLLIAVGNARRLNLMGSGRPNLVLPEAIADGEEVPQVVRDAVRGALPEGTEAALLLIVASGTCPACRSLAIDLNHQRERLGDLPVVVVDEGESGEARFNEFLDFKTACIVDSTYELKEALRVKVIPYSFVVSQWRIFGHAAGSDVGTLARLSEQLRTRSREPVPSNAS